MSAAGRELNLSPAVISKRIRRLEERLGVRLLQRTTRQLALTEAGQGFYERVVSILSSVEEAEAWVARGSDTARGSLRVSAPTSFGRMHIAPALGRFLERYPAVGVDLVLSDPFVDIVGEGFDLAIRIADLQDSSLVARRLARTTASCARHPPIWRSTAAPSGSRTSTHTPSWRIPPANGASKVRRALSTCACTGR